MMGAGNVKAVYVHWRDLPHAPFRAFAYMALVSLDEPKGKKGDADYVPARRYFAGREPLAAALGLVPPPENDNPDDQRKRRTAFGRVDRALSELTKAKAIKIAKAAGHGHNAHYSLNVTGDRTTVSVDLKDHGERGPKDHGERDGRTTVSVTTDHGDRGPEEKEEEGGLTQGLDTSPSHQRAGVAHAPAHARDGIDQHSEEDFRTASMILLELDDDQRTDFEQRAAAELGDGAERQAVLIRAAELARAERAA